MAPARVGVAKRRAAQSSSGDGAAKKPRALRRDEELSDGDADDDDKGRGGAGSDEGSEEEVEENSGETRLRLAKQYLSMVEEQVAKAADEEEDDLTFNQDAIAHRLQQDVASARGKVLQKVADGIKGALATSLGASKNLASRGHKLSTTALAVIGDRLAFTASKDGSVLRWDLKSNTKTRIFPVEGKVGPPIHALAASTDGSYVAFGGQDMFVHVWDDKEQKLVQSFKGHRGRVSCVSFQEGTKRLFSGSHDRTIKVWNLDEMCYVETLFGHQDEITGIASLMKERCVSCGRDRTVRLWKVVEESQLVFRGHISSIDNITMMTEELFCAGGQDGTVSLWNAQKKKPSAQCKAAHGHDSTGHPNWITAVAALPHSDLMASGSSDGFVRLWKCGADHVSLEEVAKIPVNGFVNGLRWTTDGHSLVAAVGQEHRLGRWTRDGGARNGLVVVKVFGEKGAGGKK